MYEFINKLILKNYLYYIYTANNFYSKRQNFWNIQKEINTSQSHLKINKWIKKKLH